MVDAEFRWQNNRDMSAAIQRLEALQSTVASSLEDALEEATLVVMADARRNAPVDTGRLRADINQEVERIGTQIVKGYVGSNVEYAPFQEILNPYLRPAIEDNRDRIRDIFETAIAAAITEVRR